MPTNGPWLRRIGPADLASGPGFAFDPEVADAVRAIVERVRAEGDAALVDLTGRFDGADLTSGVEVPAGAIESAGDELPDGLRGALDAMRARLADLHARQVPAEWWDEREGVRFGETVRPVASAGAYVPGGRAAYPSTVLMTAVPAKVAGVGRVVLCTPPAADGTVPAAVRYAARIAGVDAVYRIGGAQAVAAMAFGTESVAPVDVIVGPGNVWVTAAKREVAGIVGIDGLAGPTELVVVADGTADPAVLSADLVAQAEHDPLARVVLVTLDPALTDRVERALEAEVPAAPRREIVETSLRGSVALVAADEVEAAAIVDRVAPEHLQIVTADPRATLGRCSSYGAAFLGPLTPVAFGDYGVGSNHVLPTMATARFASGLRAADFVRVSSVVESTAAGLRAHGDEVEAVARAEGLPGHARAVEIRRVP
ncbi:MAG TPA: histidinol dehydrogenase [Actinomycetota bacterium]|jgi:histidinol dehydrogenase